MAQTLDEFLINVRYNIDAPSQQTFFDAMKKVTTSVAGVAGELTGLGIAILTLSEKMATAGEKLYWTSQRLGDSVTGIQSMAFAMSNLGVSSDQAMQSMERFGSWTRNMGPAASGYLRSLGITATDTVGRMKQLGDYFRSTGGTLAQQGTIDYAIALRRAQQMGIDENTMLALSSGKMAQGVQDAGVMQRLVWGKDWQTGPQRFADQSLLVMNQFRKMGFFFNSLSQQFALGLFEKVEPELRKINGQLTTMLPHMQAFLNHIISYAPAALHFLEGVIKAFDWLIQLVTFGMETFDKLPGAMQGMLAGLMALPAVLRLAGSPRFWLLGGLTALLILLDDYQHWKDDQEHPGEETTSAFDWGAMDEFIQPLIKLHDATNNWIENLTGIKNGLEWIAGAAVGILATARALRAAAIATALFKAAASNPYTALAGVLAALGITLYVTASNEATLEKTARENGFEVIPQLEPGTGIPMPSRYRKNGRTYTADEVDKMFPNRPGALEQLIPDWLKDDTTSLPPAPVPPKKLSSNAQGGYQLASAGNDWMVPRGFGGDIDDDRMFNMLRDNFAFISAKLSSILDTLTDMAEGQGAPRTARGGMGGGEGATPGTGPAMTGPEQVAMRDYFMKALGIPAESAAGIVNNIMGESGGRPDAVSSTGARGLVQWIRSRFGPLSAWAIGQGLDPNSKEGQMAMVVHDLEKNFPALLAQLRRGGTGNAMARAFFDQFEAVFYAPLMTPGNYRTHTEGADSLSHLPLGADGAGTPSGRPRPLPDYNNTPSLQNNVNISVVAPNPASAAAQVAERQERVFEQHIRFAKGSLLA